MFEKMSEFRIFCFVLFSCLFVSLSWAGYDWNELNKISLDDKLFLERLEREKPRKLTLGTLGQIQVGRSIFPFSREAIQDSEVLVKLFSVGEARWSDSRVSRVDSGKQLIDINPILLPDTDPNVFTKILRLLIDEKFDSFRIDQDLGGALTIALFQKLDFFGISRLSDFVLKDLKIENDKEFERAFRILEEESFGPETAEIHQSYGSSAKSYVKKKGKGSDVEILSLLSAGYLAEKFPEHQCLIAPKDASILKGERCDLNTLFSLYKEEYLYSVFPAIERILGPPSKGDESLGEFVSIPGGTFQMGSPGGEANRYPNEVQHQVTLSAFEIGEAAVTQEMYVRVMGVNPSLFKEPGHCLSSHKILEIHGKQIPVCADHPVESVSWEDARQFIARLNTNDTSYQYDLPTEAQLEFAFRGGTTTAYISGGTEAGLGDFVWYRANSGNQTHPVKSRSPNAFGIYRSSVWEWASDWYGEYPAGAVTDPRGPDGGSYRVMRGGSWSGYAQFCRSAYRHNVTPRKRYDDLGFRLVRTRKP